MEYLFIIESLIKFWSWQFQLVVPIPPVIKRNAVDWWGPAHLDNKTPAPHIMCTAYSVVQF